MDKESLLDLAAENAAFQVQEVWSMSRMSLALSGKYASDRKKRLLDSLAACFESLNQHMIEAIEENGGEDNREHKWSDLAARVKARLGLNDGPAWAQALAGSAPC